MDKTRYELYTKGSYNLFLSNLKYLLETVGADKIRQKSQMRIILILTLKNALLKENA